MKRHSLEVSVSRDLLRPWSSTVDPRVRLPVPGAVLTRYPMREPQDLPASFNAAWWRAWWPSARCPGRTASAAWLAQAKQCQDLWRTLDEGDRLQAIQQLRARVLSQGFTDRNAALALAVVACRLEAHTGWTLHDGQWLGAWWMLDRRLVEMATGEGKSATVVMAAAAAAMVGVPVHVMTANDYLASRDAAHWAPVYRALGLEVSAVVAESTPEQRRLAYASPVVYVTAREVAFDWMRDRLARQEDRTADLVLRGLCMALIDEADSLLIDEACTPLVLSRQVMQPQAETQHRLALFLARQLSPGTHVQVKPGGAVHWLDAGRAELARLTRSLDALWQVARFREEQVGLALTALHGLERDVHYLVRDGQVQLIDGPTGRLAPGRVWSRGLHQMVCLKEKLRPEMATETLAQTTFQAFFPRYLCLAGLSGTLLEERRELLAVYGLGWARVPLRQASRCFDEGLSVCASVADKWLAVARRVAQAVAAAQPVLVGVHSVAECDALSAVLTAQGLTHQVLHARLDGLQGEHERAVIARAGEPGQVTVATHMAGRGTDIALGPTALAAGGLLVICAHFNPSGRLDRQLAGRSARQGQPGRVWQVLALEELDAPLARLAWRLMRPRQEAAGSFWPWLCGQLQHRLTVSARRARWAMLQSHRQARRQLLLAGDEDRR